MDKTKKHDLEGPCFLMLGELAPRVGQNGGSLLHYRTEGVVKNAVFVDDYVAGTEDLMG